MSARRLHVVPELGPYEIHVGALTAVHVGLTVAIQRHHNTLTGPLRCVPMQSMGDKRLLVVQLGDYNTALHPTAKVWVIPADHQATVNIAPRSTSPVGQLDLLDATVDNFTDGG